MNNTGTHYPQWTDWRLTTWKWLHFVCPVSFCYAEDVCFYNICFNNCLKDITRPKPTLLVCLSKLCDFPTLSLTLSSKLIGSQW